MNAVILSHLPLLPKTVFSSSCVPVKYFKWTLKSCEISELICYNIAKICTQTSYFVQWTVKCSIPAHLGREWLMNQPREAAVQMSDAMITVAIELSSNSTCSHELAWLSRYYSSYSNLGKGCALPCEGLPVVRSKMEKPLQNLHISRYSS